MQLLEVSSAVKHIYVIRQLKVKTLQWDKMWKVKTVILMTLTLCSPRLMCVFVFWFLTKYLKSKIN